MTVDADASASACLAKTQQKERGRNQQGDKGPHADAGAIKCSVRRTRDGEIIAAPESVAIKMQMPNAAKLRTSPSTEMGARKTNNDITNMTAPNINPLWHISQMTN